MRRCAFLTMDSLADYVCDDECAYAPLRSLGIEVEAVSWRRRDVDWRRYEAVVIRSTWDYPSDPEEFLRVLAEIDAAGTALANSRALVRWNLRKSYLRDLSDRGVPIVPTLSGRGCEAAQVASWRRELASEEIVVKPLIGANAGHTYWFGARPTERDLAAAAASFRERDCLVQPFMSGVLEEGEFSLFYFDRAYSHAILKTPKPNDFRVQEEHGGTIRSVVPEAALGRAGSRAIEALPEIPLYARADFVRTGGDRFALMELELIEPSLYLRMDAEAPLRFARALADWITKQGPR